MSKTIYTVRVTEGPDNKFRDVKFYNESNMLKFKADAEEDGTYWGIYTEYKEQSYDG